MSALSQFTTLPTPVKAVMGLSVAGALGMATYTFLGPKAVGVLVAGLVIVALLLVAYRKFLKILDKRKASPFTARLRENSAAVPQGISDPSHRAQLDDIRKKFERGLDVFKEHGKDLYSMPWYILVGEPGSGKTEMIRRCNVGFPPGLQDTLQGTGGTVNMNWWFTNHAVILDTAGKLMFDEAPPGQTTVWKELLTLLRKGRPSCPVNGMLLVIPADTLIVDSEEQIQAKAGRIAEQLDSIQRVLGVRFPVFVVLTKSDKINGFREFFDSVRDPQLQHQMLGWSNPAELDTPFAPDAVDQHLQTVQSRLRRRRLGLLIDPVHTEDSVNGRRIDQVDAMYAFPDGIMQIAPRLRRYLETIFVAGTWSTKPLFLRGIYFNSALREGDALDADLAAMFNVPVDALPEGKVWEKEKSYFIRDLLMSKVFREKGLVTRANNAKKLQRQRLGLLMAAAGIAVIVSIGLVTYSGMRFRSNIGTHREYWNSAADLVAGGAKGSSESPGIWPAISEDADGYVTVDPSWWNNDSRKSLRRVVGETGREETRYADVLASIGARASTRIEMPPEFRWLRIFGASSPTARQTEAARTAIDQAVLYPALAAIRKRIDSGGDVSAEAIAELVRLERLSTGVAARDSAASADWNTGALLRELSMRVLIGGEPSAEQEVVNQEVSLLGSAVSAVYAPETGVSWPPANSDWAAKGVGIGSIERATARLAEQAVKGDNNPASAAARIRAVGEAARRFEAAENGDLGLLRLSEFQDARTRDLHEKARASWSTRLSELKLAKSNLDLAMDGIKEIEDRTVAQWIDAASLEITDSAKSQLERVIAQAPSAAQPPAEGAAPTSTDPDAARLAKLGDDLSAQLGSLSDATRKSFADMARLLESMKEPSLRLVSIDGGMRRSYDLRAAMYERANTELFASDGASGFADSASSILGLDAALRSASEEFDRLSRPAGDQAVFKRAAEVSRYAVASAGARRRTDLIEAMIRSIETGSMAQVVAATAGERFSTENPPRVPAVPLSRMPGAAVKPEYDPRAAKLAFDALTSASALVESKEGIAVLDAESLRERWRAAGTRVGEYVQQYLAEWRGILDRINGIDESLSTWSAFSQRLRETPVADINKPVSDAIAVVAEAIQALPPDRRSSGDAAELLARIAEETDQLRGVGSGSFASRAETSRAALLGLSQDPRDARRTILAMRPVEFEDDILSAYARTDNDARRVQYWDNLIGHAIDVIARDTQSGLAAAVALVIEQGNRLPLSRGASETMSYADFESLSVAIASIGVSGSSASPTVRDDGTIGSGRPVERPGMRALIGKLLGESALRTYRTLLERVQEVVAALGPGEPALEYEIFVPDTTHPDFKGNWRFYRFHIGNAPPTEWRAVDFGRDNVARVRVAQGATLAIEFSKNEEARPKGSDVIETPAGWTLVALAIRDGRQDPAKPSQWFIPLSYGGDTCEVGIRLNRAVPTQDRWPKSADWTR